MRWLEMSFSSSDVCSCHEKRQAQTYGRQIGLGTMVYALGFEKEHWCIDSVKVERDRRRPGIGSAEQDLETR